MVKNTALIIALGSALVWGAGLPVANAANAPKASCTITGTSGDDILNGTNGRDVICGLGGNDLIQAGAGNDVIYGGFGNDKILGGQGTDTIYGEAGDDSLVGEDQADVIDGGFGKDQIFGGAGNDTLSGKDQNDFIRGEAGNDKISGGAGNDMLSGGLGKDSILSNEGKDTCEWDRTDFMNGPCKFDKAAPVITTLGERAQRVEAGTTAYFRWKASDSSGVEESWLNIGGASGWVTKWCGFVVKSELVKGTTSNGEFEAKCDIPKTAPNLEYSVFLSSRDYMGNMARSDSAITFEVYGGSSDTVAPTFEYLSQKIVVKAGASFEISWRSTDATDVGYSGVYFASEGYSFVDGGGIQYISSEEPQRKISGDDKDCIYSQRFSVHQDSPPGSYTLWSTRTDSLGNKAFDKTDISVEVTN
jgi:hypothetical protein